MMPANECVDLLNQFVFIVSNMHQQQTFFFFLVALKISHFVFVSRYTQFKMKRGKFWNVIHMSSTEI